MQSPYKSWYTKSIHRTYKVHTKSIKYFNYPPRLHIFFQRGYDLPNCTDGFRVWDERRTLFALSTLSVLLHLLSGSVSSAFISAEPLQSMSEWSSESLMCLYFLTIIIFLANTIPSLFLLTIIAGFFILATVNKSFAH